MEGWRSCCVGGSDLEGIEYRDSIELLRSFLDGTAEPEGVEAELDGLTDVAGGGAPKKSRPSRESAAFVCFGAAVVLGGGGLEIGVSVVLGLAGGGGTSSKRSMGGFGFGGGGTG